jgi:hypothetical protein
MTFTKNLVLAVTAVSAAFLFGCRKEAIQKPVPATPTENTAKPSVYTFKETVAVYADDASQGYVNMTISSDDKAFLADYVSMMQNRKLALVESESTQERNEEKYPEPLEDPSSVAIHFDWSHYNFNTEKGKLYQVKFMPKDASKALVMFGSATPNVTSFTSTTGYAAVNIYNNYKYWFAGCLCTQTYNTAKWSLSNGANSFFSENLSYADNMEVRAFISDPGFNYESFMAGTQQIYFRPRLNYVSPALPAAYSDVNRITGGGGYDKIKQRTAPAILTFYIAG